MSNKLLTAQMPQRVAMYIVGLFVLAFGVALSINSRLGVSPVNSIPYVAGRIAQTEPGMWTTAMFTLFILAQIAILRKSFRWFDISQLLFSFIFGFFLDFMLFLLGGFRLPTYFGQFAMLLASIIFIAMGLAFILSAKLVALPPEALCLAIAGKIKKKFHNVKIVVDSSLVVIAIALSLAFLGNLDGIREGTVLSAVLIGKAIPIVRKVLLPIFKKVYGASYES